MGDLGSNILWQLAKGAAAVALAAGVGTVFVGRLSSWIARPHADAPPADLWRWLFRVAFGGLLAVWTWLLLKPEPVPESLLDGISLFDRAMLHFILAKALHLSVYAGFATCGGLLARGPAARRLVWLGLVWHGVLTEIGQMVGAARFDTGRHGCIRDMLIDAAGVGVGTGLAGLLRPRIRALGLGKPHPPERVP